MTFLASLLEAFLVTLRLGRETLFLREAMLGEQRFRLTVLRGFRALLRLFRIGRRFRLGNLRNARLSAALLRALVEVLHLPVTPGGVVVDELEVARGVRHSFLPRSPG